MTFRIRTASPDDLAPLYELAKLTGGGFTNLPADKPSLVGKLDQTVAALSRTEDLLDDDLIVMVLVDNDTGQVRGTCQLFSQVGMRTPFYSYRIGTLTQHSKELGRTFRADMLSLSTDLEGSSEVGGLFLHPRERAGGLGMLIARSRYLYIRQHRARFANSTIAELRGVIDEAGGSPFWDGLAGRFFGMNFQDADAFNAINGHQFIADLMPKHPIYVAMLPEAARAAIGLPHPSGRAAMRMLENEGFQHDGYVDIFDGGPTMRTATDRIRTVAQCRSVRIERIADVDAAPTIAATGRLASFVAAYARVSDDGIIDPEGARALGVEPGMNVMVAPRMTGPTEINFDGIVGPSHNYAGLSPGNLASANNAGAVSYPRAAALQGIDKMRANLSLGLRQGILLPHARPNRTWLAEMGRGDDTLPDHLTAIAMSASPMWAANAATVSPASDTADGRCHLSVANLLTMPHRAHEWPGTLAQLRLAFAAPGFAVHEPVPTPFGDEGAANHMRLCGAHDRPGVEVFVYGRKGGAFPARQHEEASRAVARRHGVMNAIFAEQSEAAIAAGAFHNDVVAVANEHVLFTHEQAFEHPAKLYAELAALLPGLVIVEVPAARVSLADAIASYLFNAQLVTLPGGEGMALVLPSEARDRANVWNWLEGLVAGNGPIRRLVPVDVRQSMANGGGPACLRLRVVCDSSAVDPRFLVDEQALDHIQSVVTAHWPEQIAPAELKNPLLIEKIETARNTLLSRLDLTELSG